LSVGEGTGLGSPAGHQVDGHEQDSEAPTDIRKTGVSQPEALATSGYNSYLKHVNILAPTRLSSRLINLRRALDSSEIDDLNFEDSSHISNVLRAHYVQKGVPFPEWLPPDPKSSSTPARPAQKTSQGRLSSLAGPR
jgi:hypothetical protein